MSIGTIVSNAYVKVRKWDRYPVVYVNYGKKYISVKIDEKHLTDEQMKEFVDLLKFDCQYGSRVVRVINSWSRPRGQNRYEKVLVRLTKQN